MWKKYGNMMKCGKYITVLALSAGLWISGCGSENPGISDKKEDGFVETFEEAAADLEYQASDVQEVLWTDEQIAAEVEYLEDHFSDGVKYRDMDEDMLSYVKPIESGFAFAGRVSDEGYGYILAFQKYEKNIFDGYDQYWQDDDFVVVDRNEQTSAERVVYRLSGISSLYNNLESEVLLIVPEEMEEPDELVKAYMHRYLKEDAGRAYLESVIERDVRFTPPNGEEGYLVVYKYEDGRQKLEYVILTPEEEEEILSSDALILPEWYGHYGLQYYVSHDLYEEMEEEEGPITSAALEIAKERCGFAASDISEIKDIVSASLTMHLWNSEQQEEINVDITDREELKELEEIFSSAEPFHEGKCPYWGILTLTREDGQEFVLSLAIDSCDGFVFGSNGFYTVGKEKTERVWEIFDEVRAFTGWDVEE